MSRTRVWNAEIKESAYPVVSVCPVCYEKPHECLCPSVTLTDQTTGNKSEAKVRGYLTNTCAFKYNSGMAGQYVNIVLLEHEEHRVLRAVYRKVVFLRDINEFQSVSVIFAELMSEVQQIATEQDKVIRYLITCGNAEFQTTEFIYTVQQCSLNILD